MKLAFVCIGFLILVANPTSLAEKVSYTGHKVLQVLPETVEQVNVLLKLEHDFEKVKFWTHPSKLNREISIQSNPEDSQLIEDLLTESGIKFSVVVENVQKLIEEVDEKILTRKLRYRGIAFDYYNYHQYSEIVELFEQTALETSMFSSSVIGTTYEGRDIVMGQISTGSEPNKTAIVLECGIHAREWVSPASCLWMTNQLLIQYGSDPEITSLLDSFDILVIPVVNPDGYHYTWTTDRLWRKNRNVNPDSTCRGVDNNRNFDANFGGVGSSDNPCSETYHGGSAFSEAESQAVRSVLENYRPRIKSFVSIHSHAQLWMSPFGYTIRLPVEYDEMYRVMGAGVAALEATHGTSYVYGDEASILYLTSGTTRDYAYVAEGIVYSFTIELRDEIYGFLAPPTEILPTAQEVFNGIKAMANAILNP